jgi:hypothetical protein
MTMRYADYDTSVGSTGPVASGDASPAHRRSGSLTARRTLDRLADAVREQLFWVLQREPDATSWTLRQFNDIIGTLGEPEHASGPIGADPGEAMAWAQGLVDVESWVGFTDDGNAFVDELHKVIADITWRPRTSRALVVRIEDDRHTPGLRLVVVREQWTATGRLSMPLATFELAMFNDVADVLDWASERFGVDRGEWTTVAEDREYQHL